MADRGGSRGRGRGRGRGKELSRGGNRGAKPYAKPKVPAAGGNRTRQTERREDLGKGESGFQHVKNEPAKIADGRQQQSHITRTTPTTPAGTDLPVKRKSSEVFSTPPLTPPSSMRESQSENHTPSNMQLVPPQPQGSSPSNSSSSPHSDSSGPHSGSRSTSTASIQSSSPLSAKPFNHDPPARPGLGTRGRPIRLLANHFNVNFAASLIYHYDVTIVPSKCPPHLNREVIHHLQTAHRDVLENCKLAFDGRKNLYTSKPLQCESFNMKFKPSDEMKEREFEVQLQLAAKVSADVLKDSLHSLSTSRSEDHQSAVQALDIITRSTSSMNFTTVGRSFYSSTDVGGDLGQGRVTWFGRYQSIRPSMQGMVLNVDVSATAFYKAQPALDFMCDVLEKPGGGGGGRHGNYRGGGRPQQGYHGNQGGAAPRIIPETLSQDGRDIFDREIRGLRVKVTHLEFPRKYKVKGITGDGADKMSFDLDGNQCTVSDYFKNQYKALKYPRLPCLNMEGNRTVYVPIECCEILEQNCTRKLTPDQTAAMIRSTAKPANERKHQIIQKLSEAHFERDDILKDFGVNVSNEMAIVEGRVLDPPQLNVRGGKVVSPANGQWDIRHDKLADGVNINDWAIVYISRFQKCREFVTELCKAGHAKGMMIGDKPQTVQFDSRKDTIESVFRGLKERNPKLNLIVVILDDDTINYSEVKRVGDNVVGVITQCVKSSTASYKLNPATVSNICLKINTKLGGLNSTVTHNERALVLNRDYTIIFGADVTHPAPGDEDSPSIAAVTASMDEDFMEYEAVAKILRHRQEVMSVEQLTPIVRSKLFNFYRRNGGSKPTKIIFYRDGVSEGQFKEVVLKEIAAVQAACKSLEASYQPPITFVVVQKRHHTRLFPVNRQDEHGRGNNIPPGTVVDGGITHPREFDFFLCSHAGIQGTSKPCYYHVLWDDNRFTPDDLQTLSYQLCHCYARCTRSVSYPAPTYYSHLVAFRARYHLQDWKDRRIVDITMDDAIKVDDEIKDTMYFT